MKKKLREHLRMLANQILDEENDFNTSSLKKLVVDLYEKVIVLEYLENQLEDSPIKEQEESLDSKSFREENWFIEPEPVPQPDNKEDIIEPLMEKIKDIVAQMPEESDQMDDILKEMLPFEDMQYDEIEVKETMSKEEKREPQEPTVKEPEPKEQGRDPEVKEPEPKEERPIKESKGPDGLKNSRNDLEEFAAAYQRMPEFERKNPELFPPAHQGSMAGKKFTESRPRSLNDTANRGLNIGLNDRLAFIKHLFEGQAEDYTRVLSQINTMENFEEAQTFISRQVRPDYNNWANKEEYSLRFMAIVEKSFN